MKVLLLGSTGLVGRQCLDQLIHDQKGQTVEVWVRSSSGGVEKAFSEKIIDFDDLGNTTVTKTDHLYCCLGTTIKKAKTQEAFRKVDLEYVVALTRLAERSRMKTFLVVSSIGANPKSGSFYLRTKGEMEEAVKRCAIPSIYILRPSLLTGNRKENRMGEDIGKVLSGLVKPFLLGSLRKYRAIRAETVARAMINCARESKQGIHVLESDEVQKIGGRVR